MENKLRRGLALLMTLIMLISCAPMDALAAIVPVSGGTQNSEGITLLSIVQPPAKTHTYVFMNGDDEFARQILKNGETLNNPGTPKAGSPNKEFTGWRDGDNNAPVFGAVTVTETKTITYHAQFADVYFVFFTNPNGEVMVTKKGANGDTISTEGVTYPVGNEQSIIGWNYTGNEDDPLISKVKLEGKDVTLKAVVKDGHWITYDSQGGTYVAPAFVKGDSTTTAPAAPTRPGYTFDHWSQTIGGAAFTFGQSLEQKLTLYAVWTANTDTRYTVIHWQENANDDDYSYAESETKTGTTGAQTIAAAKSYTGFTLNTDDKPLVQQTIAGDGSTIVNVYYKRNVYDVKFYEYKSSGLWSGSWKEIEKLRITAKYGANISKQWPTHNGSSTWGTTTYGTQPDGPYQVNIETMPLNGAKFYGPNTGDGSESAYYYVEVLPGESGGTTVGGVAYKLHHKDTSPGTGYSVTAEDQYPITGFTFNKDISTKIKEKYDNAKFYYTRNSNNIVYVSNGQTVNTASKKFEESIADAGSYTPTVKPAGQEDYVFGGWYADPAGEQAYTFTGKTMPAQNITVYAKWNKPIVNGTAHITIDGTDTGTTLENVTYGGTITNQLNTLQAMIMQDKDGYTWRGWRTAANGEGEPFNVDTKIYSDITLYPYYTKDGTFTVKYVTGKNDVTAPVDGKFYAEDSFADLMSPGKLVAADGEYFLGWSDGAATYQPRDKYQIKSNHANEQNVITLTAQWGARPAGTTLTYKANGGTGDDVVENLANNATVTTIANPFSRVGYTFKGWDTNPKGEGSIAPNTQVQVDNKDGANVLYAIWTANTDTKYTVEFYYQNVGGTYTLNHSDERMATTDTTVSVTEADKAAKENGKYVYDESAANVESGIVKGDGTLVLKLYFKLNTASYTIHHYLKGTTVKVAEDQTGTKTIGETLTASASTALYDEYKKASVKRYDPKDNITIGANADQNVITVYYTVPLTITAENAQKTYDGQPLTQPDFTMEGLVNGDTKENFSLSMTAESTITNAGSTPNVINTDTVKYNGGAIPSYYNVSYNPGTLTVNKASATVTITGVNETAVYDGKQHEANGYNYSFTGKPGQITISPKPNVLAIARRTDVGTTYMGLTKDSFTVTSANYDVTIKAVSNGYVTITPVTDKVTVTVTEDSATVTYDGNEHSVKGYKSMTADNALYDVSKSVKATETAAWTAKGTNAGEYPVGVAAGDFENINKNFTNVAFKIVDDVLKINPITAEVIVTVTENGATVTYDGTEHSVKGYKSMTADNTLYDVATSVKATETDAWTAKGTNAGEYPVGIAAGDFKNTNPNFTNVEFVIVDGKLTISPITDKVTVTITETNKTITYDGSEHSISGYTFIEADNRLYNLNKVAETRTDAWTAKGTDAGEYPVGIEANDFKNNDANFTNVEFVIVDGKLTISPITDKTITITANSGTKVYDGTPLTDALYNYTEGVLVNGDVLTAVVEGSQTDAGSSVNTVTSYKVMRGDKDVTGNYTFGESVMGTLTVSPRPVTITAQDYTVEYDGQPHGAKLNAAGQIEVNVSYTTEYLAPGHKVQSVVIDGSRTKVGLYKDELVPKSAVIVDKTDKDVTENYEITYVPGTLEIRKNETEIKVTANSHTWEYDGQAHSDGGYTVTYGNESYTVKAGESATLSTGDKVTAVVKGQVKDVDDTKAGNNEIVEWSVEHRDFYNNVTPANGTLTITPRKVTLTSASDSKPYDGTPLTNPEVAVTGDGFVAGEVTGITATGSVTYVSQGEVDNLITFTKNEGFKDSNYEIKERIGKLSIEALDVTIIITGPSAIREYKPGVTHTIVTGGSELDFVYGSDKVDGKIGVEGMVEGDKILPGTLKHTLEGMYVGEYEGVFTLFDSNGKKADKPTVMHDGVDVTENYKFSYNPGKLTITGKHMDGGKEVENEVPEKNYLLGQKIPFTITVRSVSKDELKDVTVTDPTATILPDRNTANPAYTVSEDEHTATITSLAPEAEVIVYAEHEVTEDDIINRYTNEATINWGNDEVKVSKTPSIEEENPEAELVKEIVLQDGQDENHKFKLGETVYFKITVTNTGNVTLNEYEVKEVLPGAAFIDGTGYTLNNDKTVATIEKMEPVKDGQEAPDSNQIVLYAQYTIKEEDLGNKELKNIVTADNSKPGEVPIPVDEAKSVSGQKIWKDEGNAFNTRPASITLTLMRKLGQNGAAEQYRTMQLGSNGSWRYSFDHLPKHDAQENEYFYWVVEEPVTGYDTAYETKDESHCDIVNNLQTYTLTIHYWQHKLGDTKMEQAFPDYVATLYYKQPYDVESPEREGIILDDMSQARISGTMPAHDLIIDVYYHRIAYRLTIHYIYQDGAMAHEDYTWTYWFNSTYNVPSPIIPGFTPSIDVIAGRMPSHGLELTVVYVGDGEIVIPDEDTSLGFKSYLNAGECFE